MKPTKLLLVFILFCLKIEAQYYPRNANPNYVLTRLNENFNTFNRQIWNVSDKEKKENLYIFVDSVATVFLNGDNLALRMLKYPNYHTKTWDNKPISADFIAGEVKTIEKFSYGIFECNATFSNFPGSFPAFWLFGAENCSITHFHEIDIVELKYDYFVPIPTLDNNIFLYQLGCSNIRPTLEFTENPFLQWNSPHTFKCVWEPEKIEYWVDNTLLKTVYNQGQNYYGQELFPDQPMQVRLSQQVFRFNNSELLIVTPQTSFFHWVKVREFFLAPAISFPDLICNASSSVAMDVDPRASNIQWNVQPTGFFTSATSGTGKIANLTRNNYSNGLATITYSFIMPSTGESFTAPQTFWVGKPNVLKVTYEDGSNVPTNNYGEPTACPNTNYKFFIYSNLQPCYPYNTIWDAPSTWTINYINGNEISINTNSDPQNSMYVDATDCCGSSISLSLTLENASYCGSYYLSFSPNPSINETTLSLNSKDIKKPIDENTEWEFEVYDQTMQMKDKKLKIKGKQIKIDTQSWKEGIYFVKANYKNEVLIEKFVVKK